MLRVGRAQIRLTQDVKLLNDTIETMLPKPRKIARKSQKQIGKFGALSTKDANRRIKDRKKADEQKEALQKLRNMTPLGATTTTQRPILEHYEPCYPPLLPNLEEDYS